MGSFLSVSNQSEADNLIPTWLDNGAEWFTLIYHPTGTLDLRNFDYGTERGLTIGHDWLTGEEWQYSDIFGGGNSWLDASEKEDFDPKRISMVVIIKSDDSVAEYADYVIEQCEEVGVEVVIM